MKLSLCFLTFLLVFASCETPFRPHDFYPEIPEVRPESPHSDLAQFYEGLFAHFGLHKPNQIIHECLKDSSSAAFLGLVSAFNQLLIDINARDNELVKEDYIKIWNLSTLGHEVIDCVAASQDYSDLFEAFGIKRDSFLDGIGQNLYFQANFKIMVEDYKPLIQHLDAKNFAAAGAVYGEVLKKTLQTVRSKSFHYLGNVGTANGYSFGLDIDLPNDTLSIWNETTSAVNLELGLEIAKAVAEGNWWESNENLHKFWEEKGKALMEKIPASVWEALKASEDNKKVTEKLGIDIWSAEFGQKADAWRKKNQLEYYRFAQGLLKSLENWDMLQAGTLQGALTLEIARS